MIDEIGFASLADLIDIFSENNSFSSLERILSDFVCDIDSDVQKFLNKDAVDYELKGKARTYLFVDKANGAILGYFSLTTHSLEVNDTAVDVLKEISLSDGKAFGYKKDFISTYLLALIGKDEEKFKRFLKSKYGNDIENNKIKFMSIAMPIIMDLVKETKKNVGGQILYLDCVRELEKVYSSFGFTYMKDSEEDRELIVLMQRI